MSRIDVYEQVTDRILTSLEKGVVPWRVPWVGGGPYNVQTGRPYRGVNIFLLGMTEHTDPRWGTFRAIKAMGGYVRKGEKSTSVILWKPVQRGGQKEGDDAGDRYLLLRSFNVFNAQQAENLPPLVTEFENEPIERAQAVVDGFARTFDGVRVVGDQAGPGLIFGGGEASYEPLKDLVRCPKLGQFRSTEGFYSTLFHELVHSTGHEKRLARIEPALFGTNPYAREELVAEMGAAMLCGVAGIDNEDQNAAYLNGWLKPLQDDRKLVVQAAAAAQKAADLILGTTFGELAEPQQQLVLA